MNSTENRQPSPQSNSRTKRWYRQVATATLAAGTAAAATNGGEASATIVSHTAVNAPVAAGANHLSYPNGQQQMLYFDLVTGSVSPGVVGPSSVGLSTFGPGGMRFGLIRVGTGWAGLFARAASSLQPAVNNQAMGTGALVSWWPVAPSGTWNQANYVRPFKLNAGADIGPGGEFHPAPPRTWMGSALGTGVNVQTMVASWAPGAWSPGSTGYLGLKFSPTDNATDYNYGWVQISIDNDLNMTLMSMAYETQLNKGIQAGQLFESATTVPEPSAISLLMMGAAGLAAFRAIRKRKSEMSTSAGDDAA